MAGLKDIDARIKDISLGSSCKIETVKVDTPLVHLLNLFVTRKISAVPIIDDTGQFNDINFRVN